MITLTNEGKEELALAILLWKDFKCQGVADVEIFKQAYGMAKAVGVEKEFEACLSKLPPVKITLR